MALGDGVSAIASLIAGFGGFSPTALDGIEETRTLVAKYEREQELRKERAKALRDFEFAHTSREMRFKDDAGITWVYVIVNDEAIRIVSFESERESVVIPDHIEGRPVKAIGADALARNDYAREIFCPDTIEMIGACAFRLCKNLKKIRFSQRVQDYSSSWVQSCDSLEEVVLPGALDKIELSLFDSPSLKRIVIGKSVGTIVPGAFEKSRLESIEIDSDNPYIKTDGDGIYSIDGAMLLAIARPVEHYRIAAGCRAIAKKAAYGIESLKSVELPDSLEVLDEFAFSHSSLIEFIAPPHLKAIGDKAFLYCSNLASVKLNKGIESIGDSAFESSSISELRIPASIRHIGSYITTGTHVVHSGPDCSLSIDEESELLFLDGAGGLYRREGDEAHLIQLVDRYQTEFKVYEGTKVIDPYAFAYHEAISSVSIPEGVKVIGQSAFRHCTALEHVDVPDSIEEIGTDAFIDTELAAFRIPAELRVLGANALVTRGAHHGEEQPSLRSIDVSPDNDRFFIESGMLCRRTDKGTSIVVFNNSEAEVVFPHDAVNVEAYAFNNAQGIEYLAINPKLETIGTAGLTTWCWIKHIHVEVARPIEGRTEFDFHFPNTQKGKHGISTGLGGSSWVNVPAIMSQYDICIASAHDYNSPRNPDSISIYDQVKSVLARLRDPILLSNVNRQMFDRLLRVNIVDICVDVSRHDDRSVIDELMDFGYVNEDNLEEIIAAVSRLQDAAMTGYLLESKRRRFNRRAFDFDL